MSQDLVFQYVSIGFVLCFIYNIIFSIMNLIDELVWSRGFRVYIILPYKDGPIGVFHSYKKALKFYNQTSIDSCINVYDCSNNECLDVYDEFHIEDFKKDECLLGQIKQLFRGKK